MTERSELQSDQVWESEAWRETKALWALIAHLVTARMHFINIILIIINEYYTNELKLKVKHNSLKNIDLDVNWWTSGCNSISGQQGEAAAVVDEDDGDGGFADNDGYYIDDDDANAFFKCLYTLYGTSCFHELLHVLHSDSCDEPTVSVESF